VKEARPLKHALERLLNQILGFLARIGQRSGGAIQPVDMIAKARRIKAADRRALPRGRCRATGPPRRFDVADD
jgi:hypothetical protein